MKRSCYKLAILYLGSFTNNILVRAIMKRYILLAIFLFPFSVFPQYIPIDSIVQSKYLKHSQFGFYAELCESGTPVLDINAEYSLAPASGLKTVTSAIALDLLGEDYTFETRFYYSGNIDKKGILHGNIYIRGGGDPTLGSSLVAASPNLDSLSKIFLIACKKSGITDIEGSVISDDLLFNDNSTPDYYPYIDMGNYYGAGTSALTLNDNLYLAFFKPGEIGESAELLRTEPEVQDVIFINKILTGKAGSGDNGYIYSALNSNTATLRGTIPAGVNEFSIKGSISDPAMFASKYFSKLLSKNGIKVNEAPSVLFFNVDYSQMKMFLQVTSPKLKDIVYIINKRSFNLYAETLLKQISVFKTGAGSTDEGIKVIYNYLDSNNIEHSGVNLSDGCGLSRTNKVTPKMMSKLLSSNTKKKFFNAFYNSLGIAGDTTDISFYTKYGVGTPLAKNARIKSGLINSVRSHSGYLRAKSGKLLSFSLITNNYNTSIKNIDELHKQIMLNLYYNN